MKGERCRWRLSWGCWSRSSGVPPDVRICGEPFRGSSRGIRTEPRGAWLPPGLAPSRRRFSPSSTGRVWAAGGIYLGRLGSGRGARDDVSRLHQHPRARERMRFGRGMTHQRRDPPRAWRNIGMSSLRDCSAEWRKGAAPQLVLCRTKNSFCGVWLGLCVKVVGCIAGPAASAQGPPLKLWRRCGPLSARLR
jgi:hypothetical protein